MRRRKSQEKDGKGRGIARKSLLYCVIWGLILVFAFGASLFHAISKDREREKDALLGRLNKQLKKAAFLGSEYVRTRQAERNEIQDALQASAVTVSERLQMRLRLAFLEQDSKRDPWRKEEDAADRVFDGWLERPEGASRVEHQSSSDWPEKLLLKHGEELKKMLPKNTCLQISEKGGRGILGLGTRPPTGMSLVGDAARDLLFRDDSGNRIWQVRVITSVEKGPDKPNIIELAAMLSKTSMISGGPFVRGMIMSGSGDDRVLEVFPKNAPTERALVFPKADYWALMDSEGRGFTRLSLQAPIDPCPWGVGLQVTLPNTATSVRAWDKISSGDAWSVSLGAVLFGAILPLVWIRIGRRWWRTKASVSENRTKTVVRKKDASRVVSEEASMLLAEVSEDGEVQVSEGSPEARRALGTSLRRIQALHRGQTEYGGSLILGHASSPILRELVKRVRPPEEDQEFSTERENSFSSVYSRMESHVR